MQIDLFSIDADERVDMKKLNQRLNSDDCNIVYIFGEEIKLKSDSEQKDAKTFQSLKDLVLELYGKELEMNKKTNEFLVYQANILANNQAYLYFHAIKMFKTLNRQS